MRRIPVRQHVRDTIMSIGWVGSAGLVVAYAIAKGMGI